MGGVRNLLNTTLPDYVSRLDTLAVEVRDAVNAQHQAGFDLAGNPGTAFFTGDSAATLQVAVTDPDLVAASGVPGGNLDASNADAFANLHAGDESYRRLINDFGTEVASTRRVADNHQVLTDQVDGAREALSGVNLDEEMVNMLAHQRAYEAAARVMTTLDSVLDTLINRTGLVR
jgi:flagellar hook-associated protein 1 FlgK